MLQSKQMLKVISIKEISSDQRDHSQGIDLQQCCSAFVCLSSSKGLERIDLGSGEGSGLEELTVHAGLLNHVLNLVPRTRKEQMGPYLRLQYIIDLIFCSCVPQNLCPV